VGAKWIGGLVDWARSVSSNPTRLAAVVVVLVAVPLTPIILLLKPDLKSNLVKVRNFFAPMKRQLSADDLERGKLFAEAEAGREHFPLETLDVTLRRGDTLLKLLKRHGLDASAAHDLIKTLKPHLDLRSLRAGQSFQLMVDGVENRVRGVEFLIRQLSVRVDATSEGWRAERSMIPYVETTRVIRGRIADNLYESGLEAGLSPLQIMELSALFEYDIDFFSDFQRGDDFAVLFDEMNYVDGRREKGRILAAEVESRGQPFRIFHFIGQDGKPGYYNSEGKALRRAFLRAPLSFHRITSRYSMARRHPIFRTVRPHRAIDYAAPAGTPVVAIGEGQVTFSGWQNGYGNMVEIRHANGYATRYAHFSRLAPNLRRGRRVSQGQVVGYVGQTGHATGPHLHFEMLKNGEKINFLGLRIPPAVQLVAADLEEFFKKRDKKLAALDGKATLIGMDQQTVIAEQDPAATGNGALP